MNKVIYRPLGDDKWKTLKIMGIAFFDMQEAIKFVRDTYIFHKLKVELKLYDMSTGSSSEWDNF